jgi:hypothetical protein
VQLTRLAEVRLTSQFLHSWSSDEAGGVLAQLPGLRHLSLEQLHPVVWDAAQIRRLSRLTALTVSGGMEAWRPGPARPGPARHATSGAGCARMHLGSVSALAAHRDWYVCVRVCQMMPWQGWRGARFACPATTIAHHRHR